MFAVGSGHCHRVWMKRVSSLAMQSRKMSETAASASKQGSDASALGMLGVGMLAGGVGSLVGLGGSFIALPLMTGYFSLGQHFAHGTSMAVVLATASGGAASYLLRDEDALTKLKSLSWDNVPRSIGGVDVFTAACLALSSTLTVVLGARVSKALSPRTLRLVMAAFMLSVVPSVPLRDYLKESTNSPLIHPGDEGHSAADKAMRPLAIGVFSGLLAGTLGVGGGVITVPALCLFTDLDYQTALGTSLAAMLPTAISGTIAHVSQGTMLVRCAIPLGIGSLVGSYLGGKFGKDLDEKHLKFGFAGLMGVIGSRTLLQALRMAR